MNKIILIALFITKFSFGQEQFRLDFTHFSKFVMTGGKDANGVNNGYWTKPTPEKNTFVFNYNKNNDILFITPNRGKIVFKSKGKQFESELGSRRKYRALTVLNPTGKNKVIQYFEDGVVRIVDEKGMIEFSNIEDNIETDEPKVFLYDNIQRLKYVDEKLVVDKVIFSKSVIKLYSEIISIDLGFGEINYKIMKRINDGGVQRFDCTNIENTNEIYLFSFEDKAITMIGDNDGSVFYN